MYFKSDFTVILASEGEWGGAPFRLKLWTASPAEGRSIKACFDGEVWHNCRLLDDGRLQISVNQGDLGERQYMGIGTLKMDIEFYLTNADFNDHVCNEHIKTFEPVFEDENGEQYKLFLDNQGASTLTTIGTLPAFYQQGPAGPAGADGVPGPAGERGPVGPAGPQGPKGDPGNVDFEALTPSQLALLQKPAKDAGDKVLEMAATGMFDGKDGAPGAPGADGQPGTPGKDGKTPVVGVDYFTDADKTSMATEAAGMLQPQVSELSLKVGDLHVANASVEDNKLHIIKTDGTEIEFEGGGGGDSTVSINVSTSVAGAVIGGLTLRVIIDDNLDDKLELTTDSEGKAQFVAPAGSKFEIHFPHQAGCEDIKPVSRYAVKSEIVINVTYVQEATHYELLSVHVYKWTGNKHVNFAGCPIHITINGTTEDFATGSDGRFEHEIPFGTEYTLSVDQVEDLYIYGHTNEWTYTAGASHREKIINYHDVEVGLFMVCNDGSEYTKEEFIASGRPGTDVVMFKISSAELATKSETAPNGNIFGVDLNDITEATYNLAVNKMIWSGAQVQFTSCPMTQSSDGFDRTVKIVNEGVERSIPTPAATFCLGKQFEIGGTTLNGFLGAVRQHLAIVNNEHELNDMLKVVRPDATNNFTTCIGVWKWAIDQNGASYAYQLQRNVSYSYKTGSSSVLPFYAF